jgi:DNA replication factor GINS
MDLEELRSVREQERRTDSLQHLRDTFYDDAAAYVRERKRERRRRADAAGDPYAPAAMRLTDEINTAEEIVESLYERRRGKVVKLASFAAAGMPAETDGMTDQEREMFEAVVERIEANEQKVLGALREREETAPTPDGATPETDSGASPTPELGTEAAPMPETGAETPPAPEAEAGAPSTPEAEAGAPPTPEAAAPQVSDAEDRSGGEAAVSEPESTDGVGAPESVLADAMGDGSSDQSASGPSDQSASGPSDQSASGPSGRGDESVATGAGQNSDAGGPQQSAADRPTTEASAVTDGPERPTAGDGSGLTDAETASQPDTAPHGESTEHTTPETDGVGNTETPDGTDVSGGAGAHSDANASRDAGSPSEGSDGDASGVDETVVSDRTAVRVTRDVGEIFAVDDREYDLRADDVVYLPSVNAEPLVEQNAAEPLE